MDGLNLEQIWQELKLRVKEYSRCSGQNISAVLLESQGSLKII